ncbi:TlpA family protein disulfide reductase [Rhizobium lentis]|uniref:TlpA disulfide reductase family protein n=1 Tax=Rhizobium lentis TaxID=1138194 RepID=UPI001C82F19D|nr:TlpA disulfide reductase family protein [Rhizobium lentis]MBX5020924.1 TlpA family protein disulfide reductase [Rhizobium lentis]MBX5087492.1 TlpA family protein disulfide reductase [Rhizobium lentis]MBX5100210.1 TlpA family protein disulfide reductase [Rhizobium lentis]MBX5124775.1 TlpA family protein disulfide reductase [Rhizobium lentis]
MTGLRIGDLAPSISDVHWVRGGPLDTFQPGKVYILVFLTTTCGGCVEIMPDLVKVQENYRENGLEVIGVVYKSSASAAEGRVYVNAWLNQNCPHVNFRVAVDFTGQILGLWMDPAHFEVPTSFILGRDRKVASIDPMNLDDVVQKLLDGS